MVVHVSKKLSTKLAGKKAATAPRMVALGEVA
jgi:hypothetical protein